MIAVNAVADISIAVAGPAAIVPGGGTVEVFTAVITNAGPSVANNVAFTDRLPAQLGLTGTVLLTGSATGLCTVDSTNNAVQCAIGSLSPGQSATITLPFTVAANVTPGGVINTACVTTATSDPNLANDCKIRQVMIANPPVPT